MILLIDNYDSFTYNIYQYISAISNSNVKVVRNDQISIQEITKLDPQAIIFSPGPGLPSQNEVCMEIVKQLYQTIPMLGVGFGHQLISMAFGAKLLRAKVTKHGKTSLITHNGLGVFSYMSQPLEVMRYHSFCIDKRSIPEQLEVIATSLEDGEIMAIKHLHYPVYGLQFHPESIGTTSGKKIIDHFLAEVRKESNDEKILGKVN